METLEMRIEKAKKDTKEMEALIKDYLPYLKKQAQGTFGSIEYDDRLSLAMLTFINCVRQYEGSKGGFIAFATTCIKNRLIDEGRREQKQSLKAIPVFDEEQSGPDIRLSVAAYKKEQERAELCGEIFDLKQELLKYGVEFETLARICPKQERSRKLCMKIAECVLEKDGLLNIFLNQKRLPQAELAKMGGISKKTLEKHRKYIVTLVVLMHGNYLGIQSFLPRNREVK